MTENKHADGFSAAVLDWDEQLQEYRGSAGSNGAAIHVLEIRPRGSGEAPSAGGQVRQGAVRAQERAPNYPVVLAWSAFLLFIGAGAFVVGMAIHNEAIAQQHTPRAEPIYYCATGDEMPLYEPCKERKDQRDI